MGVPVDYKSIAPRAPEGDVALDALFPVREGDLELDIGFGRGMSLFARADASPASRIVGIEIKAKWATLVSRRCEREGRDRIRVLAGDAKEILARVRPDRCVARASIQFPDPRWKKRHQKRRVVGDVLLGELARLLAPGGELFVQTDVIDRAADYIDAIAATGAFVLGEQQLDQNPFGSVSNREKRAIEDGLPVYRVLAVRR